MRLAEPTSTHKNSQHYRSIPPQKALGIAQCKTTRPTPSHQRACLRWSNGRNVNIEREMLALVFRCKHFHTYPHGRPFIVEKDYKALEMISLKNLTATPPRLQRMLLWLQGYDTRIKYKAGKDLLLADGLSYLLTPMEAPIIQLDVKVQHIQFSHQKAQQKQQATDVDAIPTPHKKVISIGCPERPLSAIKRLHSTPGANHKEHYT